MEWTRSGRPHTSAWASHQLIDARARAGQTSRNGLGGRRGPHLMQQEENAVEAREADGALVETAEEVERAHDDPRVACVQRPDQRGALPGPPAPGSGAAGWQRLRAGAGLT
jgi:hypothetical protein